MHTLRKKCTCTRACAPMQRCRNFFAMKTIANLSRVWHEHCAGYHLPPALLLSRLNQSPDAVPSRNPSKSTLAHDAVAAVSHKHHSIIRVGAGLIQFFYGSHSKHGHGAHFIKISMFGKNPREFCNIDDESMRDPHCEVHQEITTVYKCCLILNDIIIRIKFWYFQKLYYICISQI